MTPMPTGPCGFCGKAYAEHLDSRPPGAPVPRCGCTLLKAYFLERKTGSSDPIADLAQAQLTAPPQPTEQRAPTAPGWWARTRGGHVAWYRVDEVEDDNRASLVVWISSIEDFVPASMFCSALTRWFGPVALPPKWEKEDGNG